MNKDELEEVFRERLEQDMINEEVGGSGHRFSLRYRMKKRRLLASLDGGEKKRGAHVVRRRVIALGAAACAVVGMTAALNVFRAPGFTGKVFSDNTQIFAVNTEGAPKTLETYYCIPELPEGYKLTQRDEAYFGLTEIYESADGSTLMFSQTPKAKYDAHFGVGEDEIQPVKVNGGDGLLVDDGDAGGALIAWDNGSYILDISTSLSAEQTLELAKSVQPRTEQFRITPELLGEPETMPEETTPEGWSLTEQDESRTVWTYDGDPAEIYGGYMMTLEKIPADSFDGIVPECTELDIGRKFSGVVLRAWDGMSTSLIVSTGDVLLKYTLSIDLNRVGRPIPSVCEEQLLPIVRMFQE